MRRANAACGPLRRFDRQTGSMLVTGTVWLLALIGGVALVLDFGSAYSARTRAQVVADSAALAGANDGLRNADESDREQLAVAGALAEAAARGYAASEVTVTTTNTPRDGGTSVDVTVTVRRTSPTYFLGLFGISEMPAAASATAGSVAIALEDCMLLMDPRKDKALEVKKKAKLEAPACGIHVNSTGKLGEAGSPPDEKEAIVVNKDGGILSGKTISVVGRVGVPSGTITVSDAPFKIEELTPVRMDPIGGLTIPPIGSCTPNAAGQSEPYKVADNATVTLSPNTYCGIEIGKEAEVTLAPGLYVLKDRGLKIKEKSVLRGEKVTFFLTATSGRTKSFSPLIIKDDNDDELDDGFSVRLISPVLGDVLPNTPVGAPPNAYAGVLMFQDMRVEGRKKKDAGDWGGKLQIKRQKTAKNVSDCGGKTDKLCQTLELQGLVHIPGMSVVVGKKAGLDADRTVIVARRLQLEDEAWLKLNTSTTSMPNGTPFRRVTLIR